MWAILLALVTGFIAQALVGLIGLITNISFYGRWSTQFSSPANNHLGWLVLFIPAIGGLVVGVMARYGSKAIRGHGIPEAMEQVLLNESKIPKRITFLKPLSAAVSIGTGGPFGAEGPIIATGGALGSLVGQLLHMTPNERKTLLAAGAAAGMAATFGSPVSAVLLAIELLLFEYRPRSIVPVALASAAATAVRMLYVGTEPIFAMPLLERPGGEALAIYVLVGALVGWLSVYVTHAVYWIEDLFEKLPVHWMWWPALGGLVVGGIGIFAPHTLGVGYDNIEGLVAGRIAGRVVLFLCIMKFLSWSISLGSGTSGGTLAPLFTIGGATGVALGELLSHQLPSVGIDPRICALVGMAAMFAGASRALLASVVFAFETTLQPMGLLPLLGGCTAGYLVSSLLMRNTIMTEKLARRGVRVPADYAADYLEQVRVGDACSMKVVSLPADSTLGDAGSLLDGHQGFPVVDTNQHIIGVVTRRDFLGKPPSTRVRDLVRRAPSVVFADMSLREAADHMVRENVGRLPVVERSNPRKLIGIVTRSDLLTAHATRLRAE
ncbi:MAG TPA: chloride channel protein [Thermoanaerobaculia bacterium]|nr:chloride channel protein [Thermoanaerobaculia bacterium]